MYGPDRMTTFPRLSKGRYAVYVLLLLLGSAILSVLIPPLQSPDEREHLTRAYLLTQGEILLESQPGVGSGGNIDRGLHEYLQFYFDKFLADRTAVVHKEDVEEASKFRWSTESVFTPTGANVYFPLIYAPHALGLAVGEALDLSIDTSYYLTRWVVLLTCCAILAWAFRLYPPPVAVCALLLIPMSIFQFASPSLDGVATAVSILGVAAFARIVLLRERAGAGPLILLSIAVFLVASSRTHLLPMVLLIFTAAYFGQGKRAWAAGTIVTLLLIGWVGAVMQTNVDLRVDTGLSPSRILMHYMANPLSFLSVLYNTVTDPDIFGFYVESFAGVLGWHSIWFADWVYWTIYSIIAVAVLLSISRWQRRQETLARLSLVVCAVSAVFLTFLALLITWNVHPATVIHGVQGRYFLIPSILTAYAFSWRSQDVSPAQWRNTLGVAVVLTLCVFSFSVSAHRLLEIYHLSPRGEQTHKIGSLGTGRHFGELVQGREFVQTFVAEGELIRRVRVMAATFARPNSSSVTMQVLDDNGVELFAATRSVDGLQDNDWLVVPMVVPVERGKLYRLRMTSYDATAGNAITWWAAHNDAYEMGAGYVDNVRQPVDFAFQIEFALSVQ